ncbi:MAG: MFS transporter [Paracoccaceae bacterium]
MSVLSFAKTNAPWLGAGAILTFLSSFGQTFFISVFAGEIRVAFDLSHGAWGAIYSLGTTVSAIVMVWAGGLTDRFRVRTLGPIVLAGLAVACLFLAIVPVVWLLPLAVFLLRLFGQGMCSHTAVVAMARWFVAMRGRALSLASLGFSVGEALLPILFVGLLTLFNWRTLWVVCALICLLGIPILIRLLREERTPQSIAQGQSSLGMKGRHWTRGEALRHPLFWFVVPAILGPSAFNTAFFFHQVHFAEIKGWAHLELVAMFPVYTLGSIAAMVTYGWALDRFGTARLMYTYQLPMTLCFLLFSFASGPGLAVAGFLAMAVTSGANATLPNAFWAEFFGTRHIGSIKAMATAVMVLGSAIGPGVTGVLIDMGIGLETQFIYVSVYFLLTSLGLWVGVSRYKSDLKISAAA